MEKDYANSAIMTSLLYRDKKVNGFLYNQIIFSLRFDAGQTMEHTAYSWTEFLYYCFRAMDYWGSTEFEVIGFKIREHSVWREDFFNYCLNNIY